MALNATRKCEQIGEIGSPLSVITAELRGHAESMDRTATEVLSLVDEIRGGAKTLMSDDAGAEESTTIGAKQALEVAAKRIRLARDNTEKDISTVAFEGAAVLEVLKLSSDRLRFRSEVGALMDDVRDQMATLSDGALNKGEPVPEELWAVLDGISGLYTMARERTIHARFMEDFGVEAREPDEDAATPDSELELF
jgi:hypothetical protein